MPARQYFLPRDTYFCCSRTWCVFLDLVRDRYRCLVRQEWEALMPFLQGSPATQKSAGVASSESIHEIASSESEQTLAKLAEHGFLTTNPDHGRPCTPTTFLAPTRDLGLAEWRARRKVSVRDTWYFMRAACRTARSMKRRPLATIVAELEKRQSSASSGRQSSDLRSLRRRMAEFQTLRPWFPRAYRCLFDSLAAARYLAHFGHVPALVFGVQAEPFEAHCWLQQDDVVVNDQLDTVSVFSPVFVVHAG